MFAKVLSAPQTALSMTSLLYMRIETFEVSYQHAYIYYTETNMEGYRVIFQLPSGESLLGNDLNDNSGEECRMLLTT